MKTSKDFRFSIIIPNYNGEKYLKICLDAILAQRYKNYEIIVIDGKSKDNSHKILESYGDNIVWIKEKDKGISDAFNIGLQHVTGDFVLYLGSDDIIYDDNVLYEINQYIDKINKIKGFTNFNIITPAISFYPTSGRYIKVDNSNKEITVNNLIKHGTIVGLENIFFNVKCIKSCKLDIYKKYAMDYDVCFKLLKKGENFIRYKDVTTINIFFGNITSAFWLEGYYESLCIAYNNVQDMIGYIYIFKRFLIYILLWLKNFIKMHFI